jgi:hypothetical protein
VELNPNKVGGGHYSTLVESNRVVWVLFDFKGHVLVLANICASNDARERETLWDCLIEEFPQRLVDCFVMSSIM